LTQFVSPLWGKSVEVSWRRTAFARTTQYVAEHLSPPSTRCECLSHHVAGGRDHLLTHHMTVLTENLSVHAKKAHGNRSIHATMLMHDVTTAYAAETPAKAFRVVSKDCKEKSTGYAQKRRTTRILSNATRFLTNNRKTICKAYFQTAT
jgi:hypothetical protein